MKTSLFLLASISLALSGCKVGGITSSKKWLVVPGDPFFRSTNTINHAGLEAYPIGTVGEWVDQKNGIENYFGEVTAGGSSVKIPLGANDLFPGAVRYGYSSKDDGLKKFTEGLNVSTVTTGTATFTLMQTSLGRALGALEGDPAAKALVDSILDDPNERNREPNILIGVVIATVFEASTVKSSEFSPKELAGSVLSQLGASKAQFLLDSYIDKLDIEVSDKSSSTLTANSLPGVPVVLGYLTAKVTRFDDGSYKLDFKQPGIWNRTMAAIFY